MPFKKLRQLMTSPSAIAWGGSALLLLITILVHHDALNGSWCYDDLVVIIPTRDHSLSQLLFSPRDWQTFDPYNFTPGLMGKYKLDIILFGLDPRGFLLHSLINLAAVTILTYHLLARYYQPLLSFLVCLGFLLAIPTFAVVNILSYNHYVAGLFFVIASIYTHQNACRSNMTCNLLVSTGLFFLALMCKELFAMVLLYFILRSWRSPVFVRSLVLYPGAMIIFIAWRWHMLGGIVGGYGFNDSIIDRLDALSRIHRIIFGSDVAAIACIGAVGAVTIYHRLFDRRQLLYLVAFVLAAYAPLLFATANLRYSVIGSIRLAFFPTWLCFVGITYIATLLWEKGNKKTAGVILLGFLATTTVASMQQLVDFRSTLRESTVQTAFVRNGGPESAIFLSSEFAGGDGNTIRRLAQLAGLTPSNVIVSQDDLVPGIKSYWAYDAHCECMVQYSPVQAQERLAKILRTPIDNAPIALLAFFQSRQGMVNYLIAPDLKSSYMGTIPGLLAKEDPAEKWPHTGMSSVSGLDVSRARIHRIRDDGLTTSTPGLKIPWTGTVQWERGVFLSSPPRLTTQQVTCQIDSPTRLETHLKRASPLEILGWIQASSDIKPDATPFAALSGKNEKYYVSNLYRKLQPDAKIPVNPKLIGAHILDADLTRIEPGTYRLLLGVESAICDTGSTLVLE